MAPTKAATTVAPVTMIAVPVVPAVFPPPPSNIEFSLEEIRRHKNYHLINANSCGLQTTRRIVQGIKGV